jgi:hypothetical protein
MSNGFSEKNSAKYMEPPHENESFYFGSILYLVIKGGGSVFKSIL